MTQPGDVQRGAARATVVAYRDTAAPNPALVLIDACVVIDLVNHEQSMITPRPGQPRRGRRHSDLVTWLSRQRAAKTRLIVTPAVLEEVFHVLSRDILEGLGKRLRCSTCVGANEKQLRQHHPAEFTKARRDCVVALRGAVMAARKHGAQVWIGDGSAEQSAVGTKILDAFIALVDGCIHVGGKDALHIVTAALVECRAFASRDEGFQHVPGISVYCERA